MKKLKSNIKKFILLFFKIIPIKNNQIIFFSYYGANYGCSPKYITEYLLEHYPEEYKIIWAFNYPEKFKTLKFNVIKYGRFKFLYHFCRSKYICTNFNLTTDLKKRKGQIYIQTWHNSTRLKRTHSDVEKILSNQFIEMAKNDSRQIDYIFCGSKFMHDIIRNSFWYKGKILDFGLPRNDSLIRLDTIKLIDIKNKIGISDNIGIVLYAPTFRKGLDLNFYSLDFKRLLKFLEEKYQKKWIIILRLHPHLISKVYAHNFVNDNIIDLTQYPDITEILMISDILITDYSSIMFDFALTKRPIFLYATDKNYYTKNDFGFYFNLNSLPFSFSKSNDELLENINKFNLKEYLLNLNSFMQKIGNFEVGAACEKFYSLILKSH